MSTSPAKATALDPSPLCLPSPMLQHAGGNWESTPVPAADSAGPKPQYPLGRGEKTELIFLVKETKSQKEEPGNP